MVSAQHGQRSSRKATSAALRLLAALIAALLATSALGQIAHFLVVPHAICAEHGELVELSGDSHDDARHADHASTSDETTTGDTARAPSQLAESHDHCQMLADGQRQQTLPAAAVVALLPATASATLELGSEPTAWQSLATLALAPKTSPPAARSVG